MAEGNRLLHEEGWRGLLGRAGEQALSGGLFERHGARSHGAGSAGAAGLGARATRDRARRPLRERWDPSPRTPPRRGADATRSSGSARLAERVLEAAAPSFLRLPGAS